MKKWRFWLFYILCGVLPTVFCGLLLYSNTEHEMHLVGSGFLDRLWLGVWAVLPAFILGVAGLLRPFKPNKTVSRILLFVAGGCFLLLITLELVFGRRWVFFDTEHFLRSIDDYIRYGLLAFCCFLPWRMRRTRWALVGITLVMFAVVAVQNLPHLHWFSVWPFISAWQEYLNQTLLVYPLLPMAAMALCPRPKRKWTKKLRKLEGEF